jgi:hypothetical protein
MRDLTPPVEVSAISCALYSVPGEVQKFKAWVVQSSGRQRAVHSSIPQAGIGATKFIRAFNTLVKL